MRKLSELFFRIATVICVGLAVESSVVAQEREIPGKSIGKVSAVGDLVLMELDNGALGEQNLFDLGQRTLRFTPGSSGYRVENLTLHWDEDFGQELKDHEVTLHNFSFPFSGKSWNSFSVGVTGSIRFGEPNNPPGFSIGGGGAPRDQGGVSIARFDALGEAAANLVNTVPAICVFFKPRMSGKRYVKEAGDRVIVTWDVTEPWGNIQDFTWTKTVNRFQVTLQKNGTIEMSYQQLAAKDAIVGVYPLVSANTEKTLATIPGTQNPSVPPHLDLQNLKLSVLDGLLLKVTLESRGPVLPEGDSGISGIGYRVHFDAKPTSAQSAESSAGEATWTIRGFAPRRANAGSSRYIAFGPGVSRSVKVSGNTISIQGILPSAFHKATQIEVSGGSSASGSDEPVARIVARSVRLTGMRDPELHLSSLRPADGPFPVVYESFHYYALPNPRDLSCTVIKGLGDKFDFLAYYSDFRVDNQEAGTPSDGPLGTAIGGPVTGIGATQRGLESYCTPGRFQWEFIQPVYAGSNQMQERPPENAPIGTDHDITFYEKPLAEPSQDGKIPPYMYGISQIAHEMGHRWAAFVSAKVGDETIPLGPTHWARGLQARVAFPYQRPIEASIMGGGVWLDNFDGTFTQLDDDYYVPATGWSYLDLYLMGLISPAEVPDFYILRNLAPAGKDANGHAIFKADRTKVTIHDVVAAEGERLPGVEKSQRRFNTGMVMVVQHGNRPSSELMERTEGIRKQWIDYFSVTTGRRASMTANPN